jgi:hypothetical protein
VKDDPPRTEGRGPSIEFVDEAILGLRRAQEEGHPLIERMRRRRAVRESLDRVLGTSIPNGDPTKLAAALGIAEADLEVLSAPRPSTLLPRDLRFALDFDPAVFSTAPPERFDEP